MKTDCVTMIISKYIVIGNYLTINQAIEKKKLFFSFCHGFLMLVKEKKTYGQDH